MSRTITRADLADAVIEAARRYLDAEDAAMNDPRGAIKAARSLRESLAAYDAAPADDSDATQAERARIIAALREPSDEMVEAMTAIEFERPGSNPFLLIPHQHLTRVALRVLADLLEREAGK